MNNRALLDAGGQPIAPARIARARMMGGYLAPGGPGMGYPGGIGGPFAYDAANVFGEENALWQPYLRSPDTEINYDRDRMVARNRDLHRNDGWAKGALTRIADSAIGSQFRLVAKPDYRALRPYGKTFDAAWADEFGRAVEAEWRMWADDPAHHCDATRKLTVTQMFWLALMHQLKDGEALGMLLWAPERMGYGAARYSTVLQLISPDRLSNPYMQMDTHRMRGGVEIDELGAPIAYHIRRAHQNDWYDAKLSMEWESFPRETPWGRPIVVHHYEFEDIAQHRGLGALTPVLNRLRMLMRYDSAELQQALIQTIFATFVQSPYDPQDVENAMGGDGEDSELSTYQQLRQDFHSANPVMVGGARVPILPPGEDIKTVAPTRPNSNFDPFQAVFLRNLAAATGQSAEQISWDYSKTNYSSARAALLEAWKTLTRRRDNFAIGFANPVYCAFLEEAIDSGRVPMPANAPDFIEMRAAYARCRWIGPARGWVDPVAERQGAVLGLDAGFDTLEQQCAEQGADFEENLDQRAVEVRMFKERDLPLPEWAAGMPAMQTAQPQQKPDAQ